MAARRKRQRHDLAQFVPRLRRMVEGLRRAILERDGKAVLQREFAAMKLVHHAAKASGAICARCVLRGGDGFGFGACVLSCVSGEQGGDGRGTLAYFFRWTRKP